MAHVRQFDTGATRDDLAQKADYEGYLSPVVIERYGRYMLAHQICADGSPRASDHWQLGIPRDEYIKSAWRHLQMWWTMHRSGKVSPLTEHGAVILEDALCALLFNTIGYLHETLKAGVDRSTLRDHSGCPHVFAASYYDPLAQVCVHCGRLADH